MSVEILLMSYTSVWQSRRLGLMLWRKNSILSALALHCIAFASCGHGGSNNIGQHGRQLGISLQVQNHFVH